MTHALPQRLQQGPSPRWHRFVSVAASSRSAQELLTAELGRPVSARLVSNHVLTPRHPLPLLQLAADELPIRIVEHQLVDTWPPHRPLAVSCAVLVAARLPSAVRGPARRGENTLAALLERAGVHWIAETSDVEQLTAAEAGVPTVRLTRQMYLLATPIALVIEDIPLPDAVPDPDVDPGPDRRRQPGHAARRGPPQDTERL